MAMFDSFGDAVSALKLKAYEAAAKAYINQRIENYGSVSSLTLDPVRRLVSAQLELKGESGPVSVEAGPYEILDQPGASAIRFAGFQTSRAWITAALNDFLAGRTFPLPESVRRALASL